VLVGSCLRRRRAPRLRRVRASGAGGGVCDTLLTLTASGDKRIYVGLVSVRPCIRLSVCLSRRSIFAGDRARQQQRPASYAVTRRTRIDTDLLAPPYSMRSKVYVTVGCPSVCPTQPTHAAVAGLLLCARRIGDIDQLLQQRRANTDSATMSATLSAYT